MRTCCICMCECVCIYMYTFKWRCFNDGRSRVCMWVCVCVCLFVYVCQTWRCSVQVYRQMNILINTHKYTYIPIHSLADNYVEVFECRFLYVHAYISIHTYTQACRQQLCEKCSREREGFGKLHRALQTSVAKSEGMHTCIQTYMYAYVCAQPFKL
jgi:hypothetical protein